MVNRTLHLGVSWNTGSVGSFLDSAVAFDANGDPNSYHDFVLNLTGVTSADLLTIAVYGELGIDGFSTCTIDPAGANISAIEDKAARAQGHAGIYQCGSVFHCTGVTGGASVTVRVSTAGGGFQFGSVGIIACKSTNAGLVTPANGAAKLNFDYYDAAGQQAVTVDVPVTGHSFVFYAGSASANQSPLTWTNATRVAGSEKYLTGGNGLFVGMAQTSTAGASTLITQTAAATAYAGSQLMVVSRATSSGIVFEKALTNNDSGNDGYSFRGSHSCAVGRGPLGKVRVRFEAGTGAGWVVAHAAIGVAAGVATPPAAEATDTLSTPNELLFGGVSGFSIAAGATIVSDWVTITNNFTTSDKLVVIMDITSGSERISAAAEGHTYYKSATTSYNTADTVSWGAESVTVVAGVNLIETQ